MDNSNGSSKPRVIDITEFNESEPLFQSNGVAYVKRTVNGQEEILRLRIRSTSLNEILDKVKGGAPRPPTKAAYVVADSPHGRELKLQPGERRWVYIPDLNDDEYVKAHDAYQRMLTLETINQALIGTWRNKAGQVVTGRDEKIAILEAMGLTAIQFNQLTAEINKLTELTEAEREAFFGVNSGVEEPSPTSSPAYMPTA